MEERLKIAIQKKGRLHDDTLNMFKNAGFRFTRDSTGFIMPCENAEFDLVLLRDDDIPTVVAQGAFELGIVGYNVYYEDCLGSENIKDSTEILQKFPFGKCRLSCAHNYGDVDSGTFALFMAHKIATSYPNTVKEWLSKTHSLTNDRQSVEIIEMKGSVELAPRFGIADAICDLVSSGMTLKENHLVEGETILHSTAILIANNNFNQSNETYKHIIETIEENTSAKDKKYIMFNCEEKNLEEILKIIDFVESPTVMPLAKKGMNAVHIMCSENDFRAVHNKLKQAGATSILVMSVEKVM